ncbi:arylformamidase [Arthrobacter sp. AG367]|nr:arylformamidase [Arthrobacter sp. AG367]
MAPAAGAATDSKARRSSGLDGEHIFLDYTQESLDAAYNQLHYAPNGLSVVARYSELSKDVRASRSFTTHSYGQSAEETLDYFPAASAGAPICIFIHGGEWRSGTKEMYSFLAPRFVDSGISFVTLDFASIPKARIPDMAEQVSTAVEWVFQNSRQLGGDPNRIFIAGHSSGAHLAAVLATSDWRGSSVPRDVIKGTLCLGGMYDLYPVLLSYRRDYVVLSDKERDSLSPALHLDSIRRPVLVACGTKETPEFQRHASSFAAALRQKAFDFVQVQDSDHFEALLQLADPGSSLARSAVDLILTQA